MYALGGFLSSFLQRYHHLNSVYAGWLSGLIYGCGAVGIFVGGWFGDHAIRRGPAGRLMIPCRAAAIAVVPILVGLLLPSGLPWPCAVCLLLGCGLLYFYYGTVYATIQDLHRPEQRGLAMSTYFCGMYLLGAIWGNAATGKLSDYFAVKAAQAAGVLVDRALPIAKSVPEEYRAEGLRNALFIVPVLAALLSLILWAAARQLRKAEISGDGT